MKRVRRVVMMLVALMIIVSAAYTGVYAKNVIKIEKIPDLSYTISPNTKFMLPTKIKAILTNHKTTMAAVIWKPGKATTDKEGTFIFKGTCKGYSKTIILKLVVKKASVTKVNNGDNPSKINSQDTNSGKDSTVGNTTKEKSNTDSETSTDNTSTIGNGTSSTIDTKYSTKEITSQSMDVLKELGNAKYQGKAAGSQGYDDAAKYLAAEFKKAGVVPFFKDDSYFQKFSTQRAELISESLVIGGHKYGIMKDYMPYARCSSGEFSGNKIVYVGAGRENDYTIDTTNSIVIFKWFDAKGAFAGGIMDRINYAKQHGAKAVLIVTNGELKIGNYEHPLNGVDQTFPCVYISQDVAAKEFGIPGDDNPVRLTDKQIDINIDIKRTSSESENILGVIPGKNEDKGILITTNLDGFGKLPDGRIYENASASAAGATTLLDLAKYYGGNKPEYTIILAVVGSKWTDGAGVKELAGLLDFNKIATTIDLYAMGGTGNPYCGYTSKNFESFSKRILPNSVYNDDLGNASAGVLLQKTERLLLIRDSDTWFDQAFDDTYERINQAAYQKGLIFIKNLIENIEKCSEEDLNKDTVDYNKIQTEYVQDINKTVSYKESKHFKVYYDESYAQEITNEFLSDIDTIYERVARYNYYPDVNGKVKLVYFNNRNDAAVMAGRKDLIGRTEAAGGGFASFNPAKPVICGVYVNLTNVSHELNHLLVNCKTYGKDESLIQESQGQSFLVYYNQRNYVTDAGDIIDLYLNSFEAPKVIENAINYKTKLDWKIFTENKTDPDGWQNSYHTLGSMFSYIYFNYGPNAARRAIYKCYENRQGLNSELEKITGMTEEDFLDSWSRWMGSHGTDVGEKVKKYLFDYKDEVTGYDFEKIYSDPVKGSKEGTASNNQGGQQTIQYVKVPDIISTQMNRFSYSDDGFNYAEIQYQKDIASTNIKIGFVGFAKDGQNLYLKIKLSNTQTIKPFLFLQGDAPGLKESGMEINGGDNTIIIKFSKSDILGYSAGVAINLGNMDFIFIDKQLMDNAAKQ